MITYRNQGMDCAWNRTERAISAKDCFAEKIKA